MEHTPLLQVSHIQKSYGRKKVLTDVSFSIQKGECLGIFGGNGCGKSTLFHILTGGIKPNGGELLLNAQNPWKNTALFRSMIGFVPQENPLFETLTVWDNLQFYYAATHSSHSLKADLLSGIPASLGLAEYRRIPVHKLSGGLKKRVSIACALAPHPPLLILDEPSASLDLVYKEELKELLTFYLEHGGTVILSSHEEGEIAVTSRKLLLQSGVLSELPNTIKAGELRHRIREDMRL